MKTLLFIDVSATMLLSGCKSKEEKANELIKDDMFKVLYDFASYEPIETNIDSAFTSVYTDSIITRHAYFIKIAIEKADEYLDEMKDARKTMEIWSDGYSSYSNSRYYEAKTKGGSPDIGNYEYIFDKDFKEIINKEDLDDKDYTKIKELINEVLESKKESDETDSKNNNEI